MMSPITETYLFGPKTYLIRKGGGKAKRLNFFYLRRANFAIPGPPWAQNYSTKVLNTTLSTASTAS